MSAVTYRRIPHAAHYEGMPGKGHDLETWEVQATLRVPRQRPAGVPADASFHSGSFKDGVQHQTWTRVAPLTGTCERCEARS